MNDGSLRIQAAGLSDKGVCRDHNQDSLSVVPELGLFIVADGMGGHSAGEVASRQAIESMVEFLRDPPDPASWPHPPSPDMSDAENRLAMAVELANHDLNELASEYIQFHGMGTTLVALLLDPENGCVAIAHVGDSRCYRLRDGRLEKITMDHSWVEEQMARGILTEAEAKNHRWKHVITRAVGNKPEVDVEIQSQPIQHGDILLLCSDGLSGMVEHGQLEQLTVAHPDLEVAAEKLIRAANDNGGSDNISLILVRILDEADEEEEDGREASHG